MRITGERAVSNVIVSTQRVIQGLPVCAPERGIDGPVDPLWLHAADLGIGVIGVHSWRELFF